ncbi:MULTISPECIES: helix-turn-helix domain-containing protein [Protofrankia]|uniref:Helix-turn-helix domain-containing protein n=1 Tax=Protofrankia coriariae TaxID=1562887 RepID=A0ABR5F549_9ACTN|nr:MULTISPECIES: helix-turn-helix domain-containing protein [Protofrankia]KLL11861.1 hypothetical protein FrCorBMG51_08545 [Protofrankia coriariae]ONH34254.1 hypothetical protein BL254_17190 [Protofrankia sp. BMG5.30]
MSDQDGIDPLISPGQAVALLRDKGLNVDARTLRRWATSGRIPARKIPSGQFRYRRSDVLVIADDLTGAA